MRFHMGISFRLSSLKKFIFPILFGVLAYFFSSYLNLGQVYALENTNTYYSFTFEEIDFSQYNTFTDKNTKQLIDDIMNTYNYTSRDLVITTYFQNSSYTIYVYLVPHETNIYMGVYGSSSTLYFYNDTSYTVSNGVYFYKFQANQSFSSSDSTVYQNMLTCLSNFDTCTPITSTVDGTQASKVNVMHRSTIFNGGQTITNDASFTYNSSSQYGWVYYSSNTMVYTSLVDVNSNTKFSKNIIVNGITYSTGDDFPTYLDLFHTDSEPEPEPDEPSEIDVSFFKYVYWFGSHSSSEEILENIYCLLFLYCFGVIILKFLTIIKNTRW